MINPERAPAAAELAHEIRNEFVAAARRRGRRALRPRPSTRRCRPARSSCRSTSSRSSRARRRCRSSSTRRTSTRRCACATAGSTCAARSCSGTSACARRWSGSSAATMEAAGLPRHPDADPLQADARGRARLRRPEPPAARAASSRCRRARRSSSSCSMIAGFDRYYQIAICFRDEDLRADRVQEITQLDVEMSFPDQEFLFGLMERMFAAIWRECLGVEIETPFPRMTYAEADRRFGSRQARHCASGSRSRTRPRSTRGSEFGVFGERRRACASCACRRSSRAASSAQLEELAKEWGAKGLAYLVCDEERRGALADREVPLRGRARRASRPSRATTLLFARRRAGRRPRACSARCGSTSAASSG